MFRGPSSTSRVFTTSSLQPLLSATIYSSFKSIIFSFDTTLVFYGNNDHEKTTPKENPG
jgi:hypothetical protein